MRSHFLPPTLLAQSRIHKKPVTGGLTERPRCGLKADGRSWTEFTNGVSVLQPVLSTSQSCLSHRYIPRYFRLCPGVTIRLSPSATSLLIGGANLQIDFPGVEPDLPKACIIAKISQSARAVAAYYGKFPVSSARIQIVVTTGEHGVLHGTTWGDRDGFPAVTRLFMGQHTAQQRTRYRLDRNPRAGSHGPCIPAGFAALAGRRYRDLC